MSKLSQIEQKIKEVCPWLPKKPVALPLPVRYDGMMYFFGKDKVIGDATVADIDMTDGFTEAEGFRIRGWGRIQYLKEQGKTPEQLQDECAYYIQDAINEYGEPQLSDLLYTIKSVNENNQEKGVYFDLGRSELLLMSRSPLKVENSVSYDLTKSVRENLENEELCDFIHQLICK